MDLWERRGNLHIHTTHSDGTGTYDDVVAAAARVGLDFVVVTDHNSHRGEEAGWRGGVLVLVGEEVHDPAGEPGTHYLVVGAEGSVARHAGAPQALIDAVRAAGALGFIAHPFERAAHLGETQTYEWRDWSVSGYAGLEIWNYMSEFKAHLRSTLLAVLYAYLPQLAIRGPFPETLRKWDALLAEGPVVGIGGSDVHAVTYRLGPLRRRLFGYEHTFRAVNTHALLAGDWSGDHVRDAALVYEALGAGRAFVAYDALSPAEGFGFHAAAAGAAHPMGSRVPLGAGVRLVARAPRRARLRLLHDGEVVAEARGRELVVDAHDPGAYRVEAYRCGLLCERAWILSNPIYLGD